jgi:hypothetical protein
MGGEIKYGTVGLVVGGGTGHGAKISWDNLEFLRKEAGKLRLGVVKVKELSLKV